ncbi:unnamed protein product [Schistocephalus solidus]|uniref:Uncharacterized protein n=1 Tax=Schistocephalus solidus TaxID=70667 RepID=A0A183SIX5_SCHSO|nr:unnamed protein product [Schistocephalus solidus]
MLLWPPLTGTQLSPVAPQSWVLPSGHTPGNRHDRQAKSDNPRSNRLEWRTALVARELAHYKVDIDALSGTRFSETGQLEEFGAGYTFFRSGRPKAERRDAGVVYVIRNDIVGRLPCLPQGPEEPGVGTAGAKSVYDMVFLDTFLFGFTNLPNSSISQVFAMSSSDVALGCKASLLLMLPELTNDGVEQGLDGHPFELANRPLVYWVRPMSNPPCSVAEMVFGVTIRNLETTVILNSRTFDNNLRQAAVSSLSANLFTLIS